MKNIEKSKSKMAEATTQSNLETGETEVMKEQNVKKKIVVKTYQEATRPYFSSPCMLSEIEDKEDIFNF